MLHMRRTNDPGKIRLVLAVSRCAGPGAEVRIQRIPYETTDRNATVASALREINAAGNYTDLDGNPVSEITWEHSCLQQKCGACAMVIAGSPRLACSAFLRDYVKKGTLTIEPLKKFPLIRDLLVDRTILFDNLKTMSLWAEADHAPGPKRQEDVYDAARCLQCGCCLEVCPNVDLLSPFKGAAGFVPAARLLSTVSGSDRKRVRESYLKHSYAGCGKSLACSAVCPAEIDITRLLLHTNGAVFRRNGG